MNQRCFSMDTYSDDLALFEALDLRIREHWWLQGVTEGVNAHYDCIKAFSETDFTGDLKKIDIHVIVMHGDDDQIVPIGAAALLSAKILKQANNADQIHADQRAYLKA
jgi:pimeloyl-ACP methyl ester carboxylesterase